MRDHMTTNEIADKLTPLFRSCYGNLIDLEIDIEDGAPRPKFSMASIRVIKDNLDDMKELLKQLNIDCDE